MSAKTALRIAASFGFLAVALGAFGAHGLKNLLEQNQTTEIWKTASLYHLVHAVVLLVLAGWQVVPRWAFRLISLGLVIFSGSLYLLAVTNVKWLGAITPIGGLALLAGWALLACRRS